MTVLEEVELEVCKSEAKRIVETININLNILSELTNKKYVSTLLESHMNKFQEDEKFIQDAEKDKGWKPGEGFFKDSSAQKIASEAEKNHDDLSGAIKALQFFINRNGKNIDKSIVDKVEKAKEILQAKNDKEKAKEK